MEEYEYETLEEYNEEQMIEQPKIDNYYPDKTKTTKFNFGLALSQNFQKVTLEISDEPIEYSSEGELRAKIRKTYNLLREECKRELDKHTLTK
jgi:hypothetical protein